MAKSCGVLDPRISRLMNETAKTLKESGMSTEQAREAAREEVIQGLTKALEQSDTLGSSPIPKQQATITEKYSEPLTGNIDRLFKNLAREGNKTDSPSHSATLQGVMDNVIYKVMHHLDGFILKVAEGGHTTYGSFKKNAKTISIVSGIKPILNAIQMSAQEVMAHEVVHAVTAVALKEGPFRLKRASRYLFNLAKANIKPEDLMQGIAPGSTIEAERAAAKERWEYIFNRDEGIYEFVAFANTNEKIIELLKKIPLKTKVTNATTLFGGFTNLLAAIVDFVTLKTYNIKGDTVDQALHNLTLELAGIKQKNLNMLTLTSNTLEAGRYVVTKPVNMILDGLVKYAQYKRTPDSHFKNAIMAVKTLQVLNPIVDFGSALSRATGSIIKHRDSFIFNLVTKLPQELVGMTDENKAWYKLLTWSKQVIDTSRHRQKESVLIELRDSWVASVNDDVKRALYSTLLTTDLDDIAVFDDKANVVNTDELIKLMEDDKALSTAIEKEIANLNKVMGDKVSLGIIKQTKGLSMLMVRKQTFNKLNQMLSAHNIAKGLYDPNYVKTGKEEQALPIVTRLKTLYALQYTNKVHREATAKVMKKEFTNPNVNGIKAILHLKGVFKRDSIGMLFDNNPLSMTDGYTADVFDPNVMVEFSSKPNDKEIIDRGFEMIPDPLPKDKNDPNRIRQYMYVSNHNGLVTHQKSIVGMTSKQAMGTDLADIYRRDDDTVAAYRRANDDTFKMRKSIDPKDIYTASINEEDTTSLIPTISTETGKIIGYRYIMSEANRIKWLKKDTRVDKVLATMFERMTDKTNTPIVNDAVVLELQREAKEIYPIRPGQFITITKDHPDYGELYRLIPEDMKRQLDGVFGKGKLVVREPMIDIIFGYRKYSVSTDAINSYLVKSIVGIYKIAGSSKGKAVTHLRMVEQGWEELIGELKNTIVLKTFVLPFNILSNLNISFMHGMPLEYISRKQGEAIIAIESYTNDIRNKAILERQIKAAGLGKDKKDELQGKLNQLNFDIDNNPVKPLVDKGLLSSIVEDINLDMDSGYRSSIAEWVEKKTDKVPEGVKNTYRWAYLTRSTEAYKFLEKTTRYSDFVARYAMYNWYLEKDGYAAITDPKAKEKVEEKALKIIIETFVNYDVPTSRELQYLNDIGLAMFTKYALRIQKSLFLLIQARPDSVIAKYALEHYMGNAVEPFDSLGLPWLNNPLNDFGVMAVPGAALAWGVVAAIIPGL